MIISIMLLVKRNRVYLILPDRSSWLPTHAGLSENMREYFDTITKMHDKAVNTQEEITWEDLDPYRLAIMRFKTKLEICLAYPTG
jgi:hypothetical protein